MRYSFLFQNGSKIFNIGWDKCPAVSTTSERPSRGSWTTSDDHECRTILVARYLGIRSWCRYTVPVPGTGILSFKLSSLFRVPEDSIDWDVYSSRSKRHPCALCSVYRLFSLFDVKFRRNVDDGCGENRHNLVARKPPRHPACTYLDLLTIKFSAPLNKNLFPWLTRYLGIF